MAESVTSDGEPYLQSKTMKHFRDFSRGSVPANYVIFKRLWESRDNYAQFQESVSRQNDFLCLFSINETGPYRINVKASSGRARKRAMWVDAFYNSLCGVFDPVGRLSLKFNLRNLSLLALSLVKKSQKEQYSTVLI